MLFDPYTVKISLWLSCALAQPVACFMGDDQGLDTAYIFDQGRLVRARLEIDWDKALSIDADGKIEIERLYPEGTSEDEGLEARMLHQIASEEAAVFFGNDLAARLSTDPYDFEDRAFLLVAQKGAPILPPRSLTDELKDTLGPEPSPGQLVEAFQPYIQLVLDPAFSDAPNEDRFAMDEAISSGWRYLHDLDTGNSAHAAFIVRMQALLSDFSGYTRRMRVKPEFRKRSINYARWRRELSWKWRLLLFRAGPFGRWLGL